jgi:hypothetical protein
VTNCTKPGIIFSNNADYNKVCSIREENVSVTMSVYPFILTKQATPDFSREILQRKKNSDVSLHSN